MAWKIKYADTVKGQLRKLDKQIARQIVEYMDDIAALEDPCSKGKALKGTLGGLWRYRVEDWRVVCDIQNDQVVILVLRVGHRNKVYGGH
ncbi:MAG: type II toxin-antitoxin system RelE family toxin [Thermoleophilia bacterium]|nr:type II toxin-antitoxin system RelE/ParE family toxin [Rectinemataceae bacterium]